MLRLTLIAALALGLFWAFPRVADGASSVAHNDRLHYGVHLVAGRLFSLCPCTTHLAETQYARGMYHARSPRQAALLTTQRPTSIGAQLAEAPRLLSDALRHLARF